MRKLIFVLLLVALTATGIDAGDGDGEQPKPPKVTTLEQPKARMGKRILLIVDGSGSMTGSSTARAMREVELVCSQGVDEYEIGVCVFGSGYMFRNLDGSIVWEKMPSVGGKDRILKWLRPKMGACGSTNLAPALKWGMRQKGVTLLVVSDGMIDDASQATSAMQEVKKAKRLPVIATLAVSSVNDTNVLRTLGREGNGGCWYVE